MKSKWSIKRLSEVAEIQMGQSPKGSSYNISGEGVPLINGPVEFGETPFSRTKTTKFTTEPTKMCRVGDLILCVRGSTTGRMNIAGYDSCIGRGVASIRSEKYQDWINFFIHGNRETIYRLGSGATFPNVSGAMLAKLEIPIPPESEQKRIVAILDEAFEGIDRAIANTEKNLANVRKLFESYLNAIFTQKGDGWVEKKLGEECEIVMGQSPNGSSYNSEGIGVPLINGPVEFGGIKPFSQTVAIKFTTEQTKMCKKGDLILCVRGSTTGRMNIAGQEACIGRGVAAIRSKNNQDWVNQFIVYSRNKIYALGSGSTFPNVSSSELKKIIIPFPPKEQQSHIVSKIEYLSAETQRLEAIYKQKLAALNELKQSILQKAFTGELTADTANQTTKAAQRVSAA